MGNEKFPNELTSDLLINDKWETLNFSKNNYNTLGKKVPNGALHRLLCVRSQIREIFLEQGFEEMPTNKTLLKAYFGILMLYFNPNNILQERHMIHSFYLILQKQIVKNFIQNISKK